MLAAILKWIRASAQSPIGLFGENPPNGDYCTLFFPSFPFLQIFFNFFLTNAYLGEFNAHVPASGVARAHGCMDVYIFIFMP
jgi:hypothetical protein